MKKKCLITGITGQDGSYLTEFLLEKDYEVHGIIRRSSSFNTQRIEHLYQDPHVKNRRMFLHYGDLTDNNIISKLIADIQPDEIYNLAAQSHVGVSFKIPEYTAEVDGIGTLRILEAIRNHAPQAKLYQASTSELYGKVVETPQSETTPFYPRSPYGVAKMYGFWIIKNYREAYNIHASNGILFNHESPRRGETFVTRKITTALNRIFKGKQECLYLGNLDAKRDWGYAPDFVEAMWLMLQQDTPDDYVIATGETHSVREMVEECCKHLMLEIAWKGEGQNEVGYDKNSGVEFVRIDPEYYRPTEVDILLGDPSKAKKVLGWEPKTKFKELVKIMMEADSDV